MLFAIGRSSIRDDDMSLVIYLSRTIFVKMVEG